MLHYPCYSVTINESKEKFRIVFCSSLAMKSIVAPSSSSNFSKKLFCWGILMFVCLDKFMPMSLNIYDDTNNLIDFLLHSHYVLIFQQFFHMLLVYVLLADQKVIYCQLKAHSKV